MSVTLLRIFLFAAAFSSLCSPVQGQETSDFVSKRLDAMLQRAEKVDGFSGVALIGKGDKPLFLKSYGFADRSKEIPLKPDDQFMIASVSKGFTAAAILKLEEEGRLNLMDSIARFLPEYVKPDANKIQIHHLLTHTSGIPDFINDQTLSFFLKRWLGWRPELEELIGKIQKMHTIFEAGEDFSYSNSGYVLLARIVEEVSGMNFNSFIEKEILKPLGMSSTGSGDFSQAPRQIYGYKAKRHKKKPLKNLEPQFTVGMGGLYSTAEDLLKWVDGVSSPGLLSDSSRNKMFSPFLSEYGYGWEIDEKWGRDRITHSGYFPGWTTYVLFFPKEELSFIILSNVDNNTSDYAINEMVRIWYANRWSDELIFTEKLRGRYEGKEGGKLYTLIQKEGKTKIRDESGILKILDEEEQKALQLLAPGTEIKLSFDTLIPWNP